MASLSNINGIFDVHSTGAILFSTSHGTSGQILRSNGNAAPTWVAASTVIGGPYLPLTGGTLSGPLAGTSATFSGQVNITSAGSAHFGITNTNVSGSSQQYLQYVGSNGDYVFRNLTDSTSPLVLAKNNNATFAGSVVANGTIQTLASNASLTISGDTSGNVYYSNTAGEHRWRANGSSVNSMTLSSSLLTVNENATFAGNVTLSQPTNGAEAKLTLTSKSAAGNSRTGIIEYDADVEKIFFINEGSTVAAMTSDAKVGIGTDSPYKKLEVAGDLQLDASNANIWIKSGVSGTNGFINWTFNTNDTVYNKIGIDYDTRASTGFHIDTGYPLTLDCTNYIDFKRSGGTLGRWNSTGLGIGTEAPNAQLHINNDTSNSYSKLILEGANRGGIIDMYNATYPVSRILTDQSGNIFFSTSGAFASTSLSTRFTMLTNGSLGVGTTTPYSRLDLNGVLSIGPADLDPSFTVTSTGLSTIAGGSLELVQGFGGTSSSGDTIVFTYEAQSWKAFQYEYCISAAYGLSKGGGGGYNNNGMTSYYYVTTNQGSNVNVTSVVSNSGGSSNQYVVVTITGVFGIHPCVSFKYTQSGGDGAPRADRATLAFNS